MPADDAVGQVHELKQFSVRIRQGWPTSTTASLPARRRTPGLRADEGEENWASPLRQWLPTGYTVATKGRVLFTDKTASPEVDVMVLRPGYRHRCSSSNVVRVMASSASLRLLLRQWPAG
ncbi:MULTISPECIES: DUF6602 domain-containing protein [Gordonia]|uniref:DUF6602 domain-containing protein n=1 Tax=Gordonia TaxID=2053 RepID=UPI0035E426E7